MVRDNHKFGIFACIRMKTQMTELQQYLPRHGWNVAETIDAESEWNDLEWWEDEIWILESLWSPKGVRIHLVFLVDPQAPFHGRKKNEYVWAARASVERRKDRLADENTVYLNLHHGWKKELLDFLKGLDALRSQKKEEFVP